MTTTTAGKRRATAARPSVLRSGWVPAALVLLLTAWLLVQRALVPVTDVVVFVSYLIVFLTLPGTLVWRWFDRRRRRPLVEDLVVGTIVGYLAELPLYLLCRAVDAPLLIVGWPLLVVVVTLATHRGRDLWRVRARRTMPTAWSWSVAAIVAYATTWLAENVWSASPLTPRALGRPYVDEPFHLAMVSEFRHHVPAEIPYVDGTPLFYHWLTYVHVASSSWLTGIESIVLLKALTFTAVVVLTVLAVAVTTSRLSHRPWPGVVAAAVLVLTTTVDVFGWNDVRAPWAGARYLSTLLVYGPTQTYATMLAVLLVLLVLETLRAQRSAVRWWALVGATMLAVAGSKSTFMPTVLAGLVGVLVMGLVLHRRVRRPQLLLLGLAVAAFLLAQRLFYGTGTRSLTLDPLETLQTVLAPYTGLAASPGQVGGAIVLIGTVSYVLAHLAGGAGVVGLLGGRGWRGPQAQFLVGTVAAGLGAALLLDHPGSGQLYFLQSVGVPLVVASGIGLGRLGRGAGRTAAWGAVAGVALGLVIALGSAAVTTDVRPVPGQGTPGEQAWRALVLPQVAALAGLGLVAALAVVVVRHRPARRRVVAVIVVASTLSLGLVRTVETVPTTVATVWTERPPVETGAYFTPNGLSAARWLRAHSSPDDVVATNAHCTYVPVPDCERRNFWISAYTERRVLVEGWAYVAPESVGLPSDEVTNSVFLPFWDEARLRANDEAFQRPTAASVRRLSTEFGVDWLFVDGRYDADLDALDAVADLRYRRGRYAVLEIRDAR